MKEAALEGAVTLTKVLWKAVVAINTPSLSWLPLLHQDSFVPSST